MLALNYGPNTYRGVRFLDSDSCTAQEDTTQHTVGGRLPGVQKCPVTARPIIDRSYHRERGRRDQMYGQDFAEVLC
jgi:hypothetical protein